MAKKSNKKAATKDARRDNGKSKAANAEQHATVPSATLAGDVRDALKVTDGFLLQNLDPRSTPAFSGDKTAAAETMAACAEELDELQERLYANGRDGEGPALLLVVQGMDTSGKGGIMRHVVGSVDPQGVELTAFKAPTPAEKRKPFLSRIRQALPRPGYLGVFDRSHYEDVLVVRVRNLVPQSTWARRYGQINTFEHTTQAKGIRFVKVMLHISSEEQKARLAKRLERPDKHWKFNPGDIDERALWPAYQEAYQAVLDKTSTDEAPWYVIPADRKWYARLAVQQLLIAHLRDLNLPWPEADFDVATEKERLAAT